MKLKDILTEERRTYTGDPLETGGTSIAGGAAPGVKWLEQQGAFNNAKTILDYGAGKYGRNSNYLREKGFKVYSVDPYNGSAGANGWEAVTTNQPNTNFDVAFTSFVLNVVPEHIEEQIIGTVNQLAQKTYHVTRNKDIFVTVKAALERGDKVITDFFLNNFASEEEKQALEEKTLSNDVIWEFCKHGVQTNRGFQRIPTLEDKGMTLMRETSNFKIYSN
jgi:hypothetical protein